MIGADVVRALAIGALGLAVLTGRAGDWPVLVAAFVEGAGTTFFDAAQPGALRGMVAPRQLPAAAGAQEARRAVVRLGGAPLGGALYGVAPALPFLVDAASYLFSVVSLRAVRAPFQRVRQRDPRPLREQAAEGLRFLWGNEFLRTTAQLYTIGNFLVPAVLLVMVVAGRSQGLTGLQIGLLSVGIGGGTLVGSVASPLFRRWLGVRAILLLELWTWPCCWAFVVWPNAYVLAAAMVPFGIAAPVTDSVVVGYRIAVTPDHLLGRVESVRASVSLLVASPGPLVGGLLVQAASPRAAVAVLAAAGLGLAAWGTLSPAIRRSPSLDELPSSA
jgi:hypothetical protein